jgi:hypothetical protein
MLAYTSFKCKYKREAFLQFIQDVNNFHPAGVIKSQIEGQTRIASRNSCGVKSVEAVIGTLPYCDFARNKRFSDQTYPQVTGITRTVACIVI